jgi:predicted molibdopterin-dependent oxidoreductase YjgC
MGVCFECLVRIDGQHDQRACLRQVMPNMCIETMSTDANQLVEGLNT